MSNLNELTQSAEVRSAFPVLFGDGPDFSMLNKVIDDLGKASGSISEQEKVFATDIICSWEQNVIQAIALKGEEARSLLNSLDPKITQCMIAIDQLEAIAIATGNKDLFDDYVAKQEALDLLENPYYGKPRAISDTVEEAITKEAQQAAEREVYEIKKGHLRFEAMTALRKLKLAVNKDDQVKELITRIKRYSRNMKAFELDCRNKSQVAKISISISSEDARNALKELLTTNINL